MNTNKTFYNYFKIKNTKFLFLSVSLLLPPLNVNASINSNYRSVFNDYKINLIKNKINNNTINFFEEKFITQNDTKIIEIKIFSGSQFPQKRI